MRLKQFMVNIQCLNSHPKLITFCEDTGTDPLTILCFLKALIWENWSCWNTIGNKIDFQADWLVFSIVEQI